MIGRGMVVGVSAEGARIRALPSALLAPACVRGRSRRRAGADIPLTEAISASVGGAFRAPPELTVLASPEAA